MFLPVKDKKWVNKKIHNKQYDNLKTKPVALNVVDWAKQNWTIEFAKPCHGRNKMPARRQRRDKRASVVNYKDLGNVHRNKRIWPYDCSTEIRCCWCRHVLGGIDRCELSFPTDGKLFYHVMFDCMAARGRYYKYITKHQKLVQVYNAKFNEEIYDATDGIFGLPRDITNIICSYVD